MRRLGIFFLHPQQRALLPIKRAMMDDWGQVGDALNAAIQTTSPVPRNRRQTASMYGYPDRRCGMKANRMHAK